MTIIYPSKISGAWGQGLARDLADSLLAVSDYQAADGTGSSRSRSQLNHRHLYGKSPFLIGKSTINGHI